MVSSTSGWLLAHLVMESRTRVNQTSSNRAMETPILTLGSAAWAGILPRAIVIMAIAGRKSFASFISFISFFLGVFQCSCIRPTFHGWGLWVLVAGFNARVRWGCSISW